MNSTDETPSTSNTRRRFLQGAGVAAAASGMAVAWSSPAAAAPTFYTLNLIDDFGAVGDGVADDTQAFKDAADYLGGVTFGIGGTQVNVPPGQYRIIDTIDCTRWAGGFVGFGIGNSPTYSGGTPGANDGGGSVIMWDGPTAGDPMFLIRDSYSCFFDNLRFEGKDTAIPSSAIEYNWQSGDSQGGNGWLKVTNCFFGVFSWTTRGTDYGKLARAIEIKGSTPSGNNDEFRVEKCIFRSAGAGTAIDASTHTQAVWSSIRDCTFDSWDVGISSASSWDLWNCAFNNCATTDIQITSTNTIGIRGFHAEGSNQFADIGPYGRLYVDGGRLQCTDINPAAGGLFDLYPSQHTQLHIRNVEFFGAIPSAATIAFGPESTGSYSASAPGYEVIVERCSGLKLENIDLHPSADPAYASNTLGLVEWDMVHSAEGHTMFRNMVRGSTAPGAFPVRTSIDKTVWEHPANMGPAYLNWASCLNGPALSPNYLAQPGNGTTIAGTEGSLRASAIMVDRTCTLNQIGLLVDTGGSAGAVLRLGIYTDVNGKPGSLVLDAGTVAATATATFATISVSQTLSAGIYWLVVVVQGGAATKPQLRTLQNTPNPLLAYNSGSFVQCYNGWASTGTHAGALPASTTWNATSVTARTAVRVA